MVHQLDRILQVTVLNFSPEPISGSIRSKHLPKGDVVTDMMTGIEIGEVDDLHNFAVTLEGLRGTVAAGGAARLSVAAHRVDRVVRYGFGQDGRHEASIGDEVVEHRIAAQQLDRRAGAAGADRCGDLRPRRAGHRPGRRQLGAGQPRCAASRRPADLEACRRRRRWSGPCAPRRTTTVGPTCPTSWSRPRRCRRPTRSSGWSAPGKPLQGRRRSPPSTDWRGGRASCGRSSTGRWARARCRPG